MSNDSNRVVLGFYSTEEEYAQRVWHAIRAISPRAYYYPSNGKPQPSNSQSDKYALLRLKDEELVTAEVDSAKVPAIVSILRSSGEPSVFVARPGEFARISAPNRPPTIKAAARPDRTTIYSWRGILDRLKECESAIRSARADLVEANRLDHTITQSAKWLLDNTYLLRSSIADIRRSLPRGFRQTLARFATPDGNLHVCELARSV